MYQSTSPSLYEFSFSVKIVAESAHYVDLE